MQGRPRGFCPAPGGRVKRVGRTARTRQGPAGLPPRVTTSHRRAPSRFAGRACAPRSHQPVRQPRAPGRTADHPRYQQTGRPDPATPPAPGAATEPSSPPIQPSTVRTGVAPGTTPSTTAGSRAPEKSASKSTSKRSSSHNQHHCASQTEQIICVPPPLASVSKHGVNIKR